MFSGHKEGAGTALLVLILSPCQLERASLPQELAGWDLASPSWGTPSYHGPFILTLAYTQKVEGFSSKFSARPSKLLCSSSHMIFPFKQKQFPTEYSNVLNHSLLVVIHREQEVKVLAFQTPKITFRATKALPCMCFPLV